jgi:predicted deacetylase
VLYVSLSGGVIQEGFVAALDGYDHATRPLGHGRQTGEFASLPHHEAAMRLTAAGRALTAVGLWTDVFVPPRRLASDDVRAAHQSGGLTRTGSGWSGEGSLGSLTHRWRGYGDARASCPR